jgi:hypothetical protein
MKAIVLVESLTGNTWRAGELIAKNLQSEGVGVTALCRLRQPELSALAESDLVLVGTWVHGAFIVGQAPWALGHLWHLPAMQGKTAAAFCTFALNPGKSLDKMTAALEGRGASVVGGLALHRRQLEEHSEEFVQRLLANVPA